MDFWTRSWLDHLTSQAAGTQILKVLWHLKYFYETCRTAGLHVTKPDIFDFSSDHSRLYLVQYGNTLTWPWIFWSTTLLAISVANPVWLWDSKPRMVDTLGMDQSWRINFSQWLLIPMVQNAANLVFTYMPRSKWSLSHFKIWQKRTKFYKYFSDSLFNALFCTLWSDFGRWK